MSGVYRQSHTVFSEAEADPSPPLRGAQRALRVHRREHERAAPGAVAGRAETAAA